MRKEEFLGKRFREIDMSKSLKRQIIEKARALIKDEKHWCRGELARDADGLSVDATSSSAIRRCALGALVSAAYQLTNDGWQAYDLETFDIGEDTRAGSKRGSTRNRLRPIFVYSSG
jgi:hypothetical protein